MTDDVSGSLESLLATREIVVFCGSGGVGKTSVAAAAAVTAAVRLGGRVLVLTVDPARRLADALGVEPFGNEVSRISLDGVPRSFGRPRGELFGAMLDAKESWDELVVRHVPDDATANRILDDRLYANVTARFVQSYDYVAMERLYAIHSSGEYDLIVVDTPPTRNAVDFLDAPARMSEFFGGRLLRWLTLPYRGRGARVLNLATRPFYQVADRIIGSELLEDVAEFFVNFHSMYDGFVVRARAVEELLRDRRTSFAVVTTLEGAPLREAERFCAEVTSRGLHLGALVLNQTLPGALRSGDGGRAARAFVERADSLVAALEPAMAPTGSAKPAAEPAGVARVLRTVGGAFQNFAVVATREEELRTDVTRRTGGVAPEVVVQVPTLADEITDVGGLARVGAWLWGGEGIGTIAG